MTRAEKLLAILPSALLVASSIFVFGPIGIYHGNADEFAQSLPPLLSLSAWAGAILLALIVLPILVTPDSQVKRYVSVWLGLGIAAWLQSNILLGEYGVFDGSGIDWQQPLWLITVELIVWIGLPVFGFVLWRKTAPHAGFLSWLLIGSQVLVAAYGSIENTQAWSARDRGELGHPPELYQYSTRQNVLHVILDAFQTDMFLELLEDPELKAVFDGFTLFEGNISAGSNTARSVPVIFSGKPYVGPESFSEYYAESFRSGLTAPLRDAGFRVNLVPGIKMPDAPADILSARPGRYRVTEITERLAETGELVAVSLFRHAPHFLKRLLFAERGNNGPIVNAGFGVEGSVTDRAFLRDYARSVHPALAQPAYHFIHMAPPHPPYTTLADGSHAGRVLARTRENYRYEARAVLVLFADLLKKLKAIGLYDSSLIVLQSDHAAGFDYVRGGQVVPMCASRMPALMAVKSPGDTGPLKISAAESSLIDTAATILDTVGVDHDMPGESVWDLEGVEGRVRPYVTYSRIEQGLSVEHWEVRGSIFEEDTCHEVGQSDVREDDYEVELGALINFGQSGNADKHMVAGWETGSLLRTAVSGREARLRFALPAFSGDLIWKALLWPVAVPADGPPQMLTVEANGVSVAQLHFDSTDARDVSVLIPDAGENGGQLELKLTMSDQLFTFETMQLLPIVRVGSGERVAIGQDQPGQAYLGRGWGTHGEHKMVSVDRSSELTFPIAPLSGQHFLEFEVGSYIKPPHATEQRIAVSVNDMLLETLLGTTGSVESMQVRLPRRFNSEERLRVKFDFPDAVVPREIFGDGDERLRAIDIHAIRLVREADDQVEADGTSYASERKTVAALDTDIAIAQGENGLAYLGYGWGELGERKIISVAGTAEISLPIVATQSALMLELDIGAYIKPPQVPEQHVEVYVNGVQLSTLIGKTGSVRTMSVRIPGFVGSTGHLAIELRFPDAVCPACIGTGGDERMRAIDLHRLRLSETR